MSNRNQVIWFGKPPTDSAHVEAENRHLEIDYCVDREPNFDYACSAVFWATSPYFSATASNFEKYLITAINQGLYVHVVVADEAAHDELKRAHDRLVGKTFDDAALRLKINSKEHEVLERAARHSPGATANMDLQIDCPADVELNAEQEFLLRRAFGDCKEITLRLLAGGKSGALTLYVDATLSATTAGPKPMPYFAKLDDPYKLRDELVRYERYAEHHIAWHLRPNFQAKRNILGVGTGIIVGNFVEPAHSFWEQTRKGEGPKYIRLLFGETLVGWRSQTVWTELQPHGSVVSELRNYFEPSRVPTQRVADAGAFGSVECPAVLWRQLIDLPHEQWRKSIIHGDMHGENVRVRKDDAIVIDFAKTTIGPMCADIASLEVWLAFEVPPSNELLLGRIEWMQRIVALFGPNSRSESCSPDFLHSTWIENCSLELRNIASDVCHGKDEYRRVLAVHLLRHASFPAGGASPAEDEFRRTFAYWLANEMIKDLTKSNFQRVEAA